MQQETRHKYPIDNLTYDVITVIAEKSKALEAFDTYLRDAENNSECRQVFQKIRDQDTQCVNELMNCLWQLQGASSGSQSRETVGSGKSY